jgi:low affinity Fe/Cu permease
MATNEFESLESMVQKPKKVKKPNNWALWFAYVFFNIGVLVFDVIAAVTVYTLTKNYGYSFVTFMAGFIPLLMHESLYIRAYASKTQRMIAIGGAVISALTVAVVAVLAGVVNFAVASGYTIASGISEIVIIMIVIIAALLHVTLAAFYFYTDEGIKAEHTEAENVAFFNQRMKNLLRAEQMLEQADKARQHKAKIIEKHGGKDGKAALDYLMNLLNDDDGDGIINALDPVDNRKQGSGNNQPRPALASDVKQEKIADPTKGDGKQS